MSIFLESFFANRVKRIFCVLFSVLLGLLSQQAVSPVFAEDESPPSLRGAMDSSGQALKETSGSAGSNAPSGMDVPIDERVRQRLLQGIPEGVPDKPAFKSPPRSVPPDPGVVSDKSRFSSLSLEKFDEDRLKLSIVQNDFLIPVGKDMLKPIQLEASFTEPLSLKAALMEARANNLPINISKTALAASRYKFLGTFGNFVPSMSMNYVPEFTKSGGQTQTSNPYFITMLYPVFIGGQAIFTTFQRLHEMRAERGTFNTSINDVLLDTYLKYYDLIYNHAVLDLRSKSLEVAATQLAINQDLRTAGLGTDFEIMQAKTLYSLEKQRLVRQEVQVRRAALQLCVALNKSVIQNVVPAETEISRQSLVESAQTPEHLTAIAVQNRPELAKWEELRLAAKNEMRASASPLLPRAAFFTNNSMNISGSGSNIIIPTGGASAAGGVTSSTSGGANSSFSGGFILNWLVEGAGISNVGDTLKAKMNARKAFLEGREELLKISAQVRDAYLDTRAAETEIDVTSDAVASATEQLRMANVRLTHQIGTNLEVIQAERDYIDAVSRRIEAFVTFKKSQARLLHATGLISVDTLTSDKPQTFKLRRGK